MVTAYTGTCMEDSLHKRMRRWNCRYGEVSWRHGRFLVTRTRFFKRTHLSCAVYVGLMTHVTCFYLCTFSGRFSSCCIEQIQILGLFLTKFWRPKPTGSLHTPHTPHTRHEHHHSVWRQTPRVHNHHIFTKTWICFPLWSAPPRKIFPDTLIQRVLHTHTLIQRVPHAQH